MVLLSYVWKRNANVCLSNLELPCLFALLFFHYLLPPTSSMPYSAQITKLRDLHPFSASARLAYLMPQRKEEKDLPNLRQS